MLSHKARYALQAMILLARQYDHGYVLIADLAQQGKIPKKFLELILLGLKNRGLLRSRKGKGGGYALSRPPSEVTVGEVVRLIDGPLAPIPCVSVTAYGRCDGCVDERMCGVRLVMKEVRDAIADILDGTTFADVLARVSQQNPPSVLAHRPVEKEDK
jgi:Rrf2 family protein